MSGKIGLFSRQVVEFGYDVGCALIFFTGIYRIISFLNRRRPVILFYHSVNDSDCQYVYPDNIVAVENFEKQIGYLSRKKKLVSLSELTQYFASGTEFPPDLVAITFDDGYYDFYSRAHPILRRFRTPVSIFPITELLDSGGTKWEDELAHLVNTTRKESLTLHIGGETRTYGLSSKRKRIECVRSLNSSLLKMNATERQKAISEIENQSERSSELAERTMLGWNEIQELKQDNAISFGCHTHTHCNLAEVNQKTAELEISKSKEEMEHFLNRPVQFFSYPFGKRRNFNERIEQTLRTKGFSLAVTAMRGNVSEKSNPFELRRIAAVNDASYKFKCSLIGITLQRS